MKKFPRQRENISPDPAQRGTGEGNGKGTGDIGEARPDFLL